MDVPIIVGSLNPLILVFRFNFRTFLDLFEEDVDLDGEHQGEEEEEEEEGQGDAAGIEVGDRSPCRQHVLDGPGLTSELCHEPATLRGDIAQWDKGDGHPVVPGGEILDRAFLP